MRGITATVLIALLAAGCSGIEVTRPDKDGVTTALPGIPFYTKVPVLTHETKRVESAILVGFTVNLVSTEGKTLQSISVPATGGVEMSPDARALVDEQINILFRDMPAMVDFDRAVTRTQGVITTLRASGLCHPKMTVASNTWSLSMMPSSKPYYINVRQPLIGSATSNYKLGSDGTLTEASATVQDDTVKTILGLIPITPLLSKSWGLTAGTAADTTASTKKGKTDTVRIDVSMTQRRTVYTLRKLENSIPSTEAYIPPPATGPLDLLAGQLGLDGVQLVTVETDPSDDGSKGKPDNTSYKIQGTFTPPKAPDAK